MNRFSAVIIVGLSALGMALGHWAARVIHFSITSAQAAPTTLSKGTIKTKKLILVDQQNRTRIVMGQSKEGPPSIWLFDQNGKVRLSFGTYEDGGPTIVLNDAEENAVEIFRTVGPKSSPVLVFKADHTDRIILGLNEKTSDPYFVYYDSKGVAHSQFGSR
jgi:hypothetical protein